MEGALNYVTVSLQLSVNVCMAEGCYVWWPISFLLWPTDQDSFIVQGLCRVSDTICILLDLCKHRQVKLNFRLVASKALFLFVLLFFLNSWFLVSFTVCQLFFKTIQSLKTLGLLVRTLYALIRTLLVLGRTLL